MARLWPRCPKKAGGISIRPKRRATLIWVAILVGVLAAAAAAAPVGTFVQVEGTVEVLHQGKPPAVPAKIQDGVAKGDQVRTKSQSRAQLRFVDDTLLTISPSSSVLIEDYLYDAPQGYRQAALHLVRGLAYTVVNRIYQTEKPDFVMKTHTAVFGVRGTRFFTLAAVRFSGNYLEQGLGEMTALAGPAQVVRLKAMEFGVAPVGQAVIKGTLTPADLALLRQWLTIGVPQNVLTGEPHFFSAPTAPPGPTIPGAEKQRELERGLFVPPTVTPHLPPPPPPPPPPPSQPHYHP